ncbi:hypothetical protein O1L44_27270 [Streptomyces noursei]|nr:hypothetical protein [Streptomyces noursei]
MSDPAAPRPARRPRTAVLLATTLATVTALTACAAPAAPARAAGPPRPPWTVSGGRTATAPSSRSRAAP